MYAQNTFSYKGQDGRSVTVRRTHRPFFSLFLSFSFILDFRFGNY